MMHDSVEEKTTELAVEMWAIEQVTPYPGNPCINDAAVDAVAE